MAPPIDPMGDYGPTYPWYLLSVTIFRIRHRKLWFETRQRQNISREPQ